jgi:hypothetical protein
MKKLLLLPLLALLGCSEDFLNLAPQSQVSLETFYGSPADFRTAVNATYAALQSNDLYGNTFHHLSEVPADNVSVQNPGGAGRVQMSEIDLFVHSPTNASIQSFFSGSYLAIQRSNLVLERIGPVQMPDALKNQFIGEAKFLRALNYFNLVRLFGDVPLVLTEIKDAQEGYQFTRSPVADVYKQLIDDLKDAESKLPATYTGADIGRATRGAAKTLLGKVYLTQKDFPQAAATLKEVIDLTATGGRVYDLAPQYRDNFDPAKSNNVGHRESIFEVQFKTGGIGEGSIYTTGAAPPNGPVSITGVGIGNGGFMLPTPDAVQAYPRTDPRRSANFDSLRINGLMNVWVKKYLQPQYGSIPFNVSDSDMNFPLLRFADVLLMYAEALNEVNGGPNAAAYEAINRVRRRAYGVTNTSADVPPGLDKAAFALAVETERRLELAFEGHRWFDLVRTGRALPVMTSKGFAMQPFHVLFPIPQSERDINPKITQNDGY